MLCRSRCQFAFLISSLALIVSFGAAAEFVSNSSSARYRAPRSHRIVREVDAHGFDTALEVSHDRSIGGLLVFAGRSVDPDSRPAPAAILESHRFTVEFPASEFRPARHIVHGIARVTIPLSRGPPLA